MPRLAGRRVWKGWWRAGHSAPVAMCTCAQLALAWNVAFGQLDEPTSPSTTAMSSHSPPPSFESIYHSSSSVRPVPVRSLRVELHYRAAEGPSAGRVALWYTRDLGATWQRYGTDEDGRSPLVFEAPAEGLYGVSLFPEGVEGQRVELEAHARPQRWLFLDATPPLVQWTRIEPDDDFSRTRLLHLRWTAYDAHFPARPVTLMYQSSLDQRWRLIDAELPNSGRHTWKVPDELTGQVALKILVRDRGGHAVERVFGPVPVARWLEAPPSSQPASTVATTAPAAAEFARTRPAEPWDITISPEDRQKAQRLYETATMLRRRREYDVAMARLQESLALNPRLLSARNDLAGLYYLQKDYTRAIDSYREVLQQDDRHLNALRGAALTYLAMRDYPESQRMLKRVVEQDADDAASWLDLGDVLFMMGDEHQARLSWERAERADSTEDGVIAARARQRLARIGA